MRILHYIPTYAPAWSWGGPVRSVSDLCEGLAARGHEVTVLTTDAGLTSDQITARGVDVIRNGVNVCYYPQVPGMGIKSPALEAAAAERVARFDLVHVTAIWQRTGPAACAAARRQRVPYVISPRGALGPYSWRRGRLKKSLYYLLRERQALAGATGFHYTSGMEARECERFRFGKPACIVPNGLDIDSWRRDTQAGARWREQLGISPSEKLLLYTGRLHHKKGLDLLPGALAKLDTRIWRMVFVGNDADGTLQTLRAGFATHGIGDRVSFLPAVEPRQLVPFYSGADVFVLPSLHENFGNVAAEAAACGCRVLVSEEVGVAEELSNFGAGECLPREAAAWTAAIKRAFSSQSLTISVIERVREGFSRESVAQATEGFYQRLLA